MIRLLVIFCAVPWGLAVLSSGTDVGAPATDASARADRTGDSAPGDTHSGRSADGHSRGSSRSEASGDSGGTERRPAPASPARVFVLQVPQLERAPKPSTLERVGTGTIEIPPEVVGHPDPTSGMETAVRLDRSGATNLTRRVPQLWRHAPPRLRS